MAEHQGTGKRRAFQDLTGHRFFGCVVLAPDGMCGHDRVWQCLCFCGKEFRAAAGNIKANRQKSCGCRRFRSRPPIVQGDGTTIVPLTQGEQAIIDAADADIVRPYPWCVVRLGGKRYPYAGSYRCHRDTGILLMHLLIMRPNPGFVVDHIDGNTLNNCRANLRVCTHQQNSFNKRRVWGKSRFKGVSWNDGKWQAAIKHGRMTHYLGRHVAEEEAARAYDDAARRLFGEFAALNFPEQEKAP